MTTFSSQLVLNVILRFHQYPLSEVNSSHWTNAYQMKKYFDMKRGEYPNFEGIGKAKEQLDEVLNDEILWTNWTEHSEQSLCVPFRVTCTRKRLGDFPAHKFSSVEVKCKCFIVIE